LLETRRLENDKRVCELEQGKTGMSQEIATLLGNKFALEQANMAMGEEIATLLCSRDTMSRQLEELHALQREVEELKKAAKCSAQTAALQEVDAAECDQQRTQVRELMATMQTFKQENETLTVENRRLSESLAIFEVDLEKVSDRHAKLIGHVNPKQKLRYTIKLKDEKNQLRAENDKLRARLGQLEGSRRGENLFEALSSLGYGGAFEHGSPVPPAARRSSTNQSLRTPSKESPRTLQAVGFPQSLRAAAALSPTPQRGPASSAIPVRKMQVSLAGVDDAHQCRVQERALERVNTDFQHLVSLVERAVVGEETGTVSFATLLQRLRHMSLPACVSKDVIKPASLEHRFDVLEDTTEVADLKAPQEETVLINTTNMASAQNTLSKGSPGKFLGKHTGDGGLRGLGEEQGVSVADEDWSAWEDSHGTGREDDI